MNVHFKVSMESGNQAVADYPHESVMLMLDEIKEQLEAYMDMDSVSGTLRDENGNKVGHWSLEIYEDED